ncbi:salivary peroxidase/catechol oxidase-like [Oratosquilla oratoria]|uniref:salivary peroxidase/catechol oxidase-like n=1 Tax=Oratosquilla oratoria TaxID=337810 RepID=UPI003F768EA3
MRERRQIGGRWLIVSHQVFALLLLGRYVAGQRLPNLEPLNGVVHPDILTLPRVQSSVVTTATGNLQTELTDSIERVGGVATAADRNPTTEELQSILRQGFEEANRRKSGLPRIQGSGSSFMSQSSSLAPEAGGSQATSSSFMDTPGFLLFMLRQPKQEVTRDACTGIAVNIAFESIRDRFPSIVTNTPEQVIDAVFDQELCERLANEFCGTSIVPPRDCDPTSRYRTIDGTCNNLDNTDQGKSNRRMGRFHPPVYEDVVGAPRLTGISGAPLPNPRDVSLALHTSSSNERESLISLLVMQWGQFLDHDLIHIPEAEKDGGGPLDCCGVDRGNPLCFPIDTLNPEDALSRAHNRNCIQFARSITAPITSCQYIFREQSNQITSYIDGSQVYGSSKEEQNDLRGKGGKHRVFTDSENPDVTSRCPIADGPLLPATFNKYGFNFRAGDSRVTEQPGLASMHTLFLRVHNGIVHTLGQINPHWDDEKLYQETRRIVGALLQHITYDEWLPIVLGTDLMKRRGLASSGNSKYDPTIDATIINSFGAAALRFGHSLVVGTLRGEGRDLFLGDNFFNAKAVCSRSTRISALLRGLAASPANKYDSFLDPALTNLLFRRGSIGLDLAALNIQRGRDHGLPGYNRWRELCFGQGFNSFQDLRDANVMAPEVVDKLAKLYASVHDIDLFSGGLSETKSPGALVGPVFSCILAEQFRKLKYGDRFFFEHEKEAGSFPENQLNAIRVTSLATILCQFTDTPVIQPRVFLQKHILWNSQRSCSHIPRLDLNHWKETTGTECLTTPYITFGQGSTYTSSDPCNPSPNPDPYNPNPNPDPYNPNPNPDPYNPNPNPDPYNPNPIPDPYNPNPIPDPYNPNPIPDPYNPNPIPGPYNPNPNPGPYNPNPNPNPDPYNPNPNPDPYNPNPNPDPYNPNPNPDPYNPNPNPDPYNPNPNPDPYNPNPNPDPYNPNPNPDPYNPNPNPDPYNPNPNPDPYNPNPNPDPYNPNPNPDPYNPNPNPDPYNPNPNPDPYNPNPNPDPYNRNPGTFFKI